MRRSVAEHLALKAMKKHGLLAQGWTFKFDRATRRYGACHYGVKVISLSGPLTDLNTEAKMSQTILHEVAHALAGPQADHGPVWLRQARAIGYKGSRLSSGVTPPAKYIATCPKCGNQTPRMRKTNTACGRCCKRYNNNRYTPAYQLTYKENKTRA